MSNKTYFAIQKNQEKKITTRKINSVDSPKEWLIHYIFLKVTVRLYYETQSEKLCPKLPGMGAWQLIR